MLHIVNFGPCYLELCWFFHPYVDQDNNQNEKKKHLYQLQFFCSSLSVMSDYFLSIAEFGLPLCTNTLRELVPVNQPLRCNAEIYHNFFQTFSPQLYPVSGCYETSFRIGSVSMYWSNKNCLVARKLWTLKTPRVTHTKLLILICDLENKLGEFVILSPKWCSWLFCLIAMKGMAIILEN